MTPPDAETDWSLLSRLADGDETALDALVARWESRALTFTHRLLSRSLPDARGDAEEVVSEMFWKIYQSRHSVRPTGSFPAWLFRITYNLCADHLRKQKRRVRSVSFDDLRAAPGAQEMAPLAPGSHQPDQSALGRELAEQLEQSLDQLPENQRAALVLCKMEGLSYQEIASVLDCSVSSVESLLSRARRNLQESLKGYLGR